MNEHVTLGREDSVDKLQHEHIVYTIKEEPDKGEVCAEDLVVDL